MRFTGSDPRYSGEYRNYDIPDDYGFFYVYRGGEFVGTYWDRREAEADLRIQFTDK